LRYRSCVLMLNLRRNGTLASAGVSQMTMPSLYRSSGGGVVVADAGCSAVATLCAEAAIATDVSDINATAAEAVIKRPSPGRIDQQSTTERASPASLVSLYLLFMSLAVWANAITVASKSMRCRDAISLLAIA
jgi:hypothetical protein